MAVGVAVEDRVAVGVAVEDGVAVGVAVEDGVAVGVAVEEGVGVGTGLTSEGKNIPVSAVTNPERIKIIPTVPRIIAVFLSIDAPM